jgi:hypothetical protein
MPPATLTDWSVAYAKQAQADFDAWALYRDSSLPPSQRLHFLQMTWEKLCKAHLYATGNVSEYIQTSHAYVAKQLPIVLRSQLELMRAAPAQIHAIARFTRGFAREVELLAPAVTAGGARPDNCEYPWEDAMGNLHVPVEHDFYLNQLLLEPHGRLLPKLIQAAIRRLLPPAPDRRPDTRG